MRKKHEHLLFTAQSEGEWSTPDLTSQRIYKGLKGLKTVSSTFQDVDFDGS